MSRGIGTNMSIPIVSVPFTNGVVTTNLLAREAAYYSIVVPTNLPTWRLKLGTNYYYVVSANNPGGESSNSAELPATPNDLVTGTIIGSAGSYNSAGATGVTGTPLHMMLATPDRVSVTVPVTVTVGVNRIAPS